MNCQKVQNLISAYLDGELAGHEMLLVRYHLSGCGECSGEYESLLTIRRAFGKLRPKRPSDDLAARICSQLSHVRVPVHVQFLASLRRYVHPFPAGIRVGAVGVAVFAALLLIRGGDVSVGPRFASIPVSSAALEMLVEAEPIRIVPIPAPDDGLPGVTAGYAAGPNYWRPTSPHGQFTHVSSPGGLTLADHTR